MRPTTCLLMLWLLPLVAVHAAEKAAGRPNVIYFIIDELGYCEPGFMGGRNIQTPNIDRMATEGVRFNNFFAGSSVCAPTRCCLLTGKHSGHTSVRANGGGTPLRADEVTLASMLKPLGYATGGFGKWGCGGRDSTGVPEKHGFDVFLGYYDQVHAHSYYPPYLIRNSEEVPLAGNSGGSAGQTYSPNSSRLPQRRPSLRARAPSRAPTATSATAARSSASRTRPLQKTSRSQSGCRCRACCRTRAGSSSASASCRSRAETASPAPQKSA